jgi:hypothetical protein
VVLEEALIFALEILLEDHAPDLPAFLAKTRLARV